MRQWNRWRRSRKKNSKLGGVFQMNNSKEIIAAPLSGNAQSTRGLPDALVITAENDVLRDEGEAYARKLWEAGVRVTCTRYIGAIHDLVMLNAIADAPAALGAIEQANAALISCAQ